MDENVREFDEFDETAGIGGCLCCCHTQNQEDFEKRQLRKFKAIAEDYGGEAVYVGSIVDRRVVITENKAYFMIEFPVLDKDFRGKRKVEGWLGGSLSEIMALCNQGGLVSFGTAVIARDTGKIVALLQHVW